MTDPRLELPTQARLAVLGSPISHSRSPRIHAAAYAALGLRWEYEAIECREGELQALLASRGEPWRGFSVTMPLKTEAHRLSTVLDPVAQESGVVNTLLRVTGRGGALSWAGFNTDVEGLATAVAGYDLDAGHTIVLGAGATAISAVLAARRLGAERVTIAARNAKAVEDLVSRFDGTRDPDSVRHIHLTGASLSDEASGIAAESVRTGTLVISTLPGTAAADLQLADGLTNLPLFDVAYEPWPSPLAVRWRAAGAEAHSGVDMLVYQALVQVRIFVNGDPALPLEHEAQVLRAMRAAGMGR